MPGSVGCGFRHPLPRCSPAPKARDGAALNDQRPDQPRGRPGAASTRPARAAPWFRLLEQIVDNLVECGLTPERAVHGYRAIYYTAVEILVRATAARRRAADDHPTYRERVFADPDPGELLRLARLADRWAALTAEDTCLDGLRALVDGLLAN